MFEGMELINVVLTVQMRNEEPQLKFAYMKTKIHFHIMIDEVMNIKQSLIASDHLLKLE